ncbi:MAG: DNA mismatch repair endonuclease MutL [Salinivirgaceae bacterium]|nr:DNA mismatch repair endonuclease MutL [Salinivirgaceae bacterium]
MNIIAQLPDSIANQIAAGEVVQRPASVIKELVENAVDAHATVINVTVTDAGKTMIQVADNGTGMTEIDARMAFERHATSKIKTTADLFKLKTLGFRGEALASIAAIANVSLRTRHKNSELGVEIEIGASIVKKQEVIQCAQGSLFTIKNLFFNVPARRKFLKADQTEFRHISDEFIRVALINPTVTFTLTHNDKLIYNLTQGTLKQRIVGVMGRTYSENLISIDCKTSLANISGFVGNPKMAKKGMGDQFFFVNNRYMRHPYFNRAILNAYEQIIPNGVHPSYFVTFDIDPECIDVNIHPTKTEIKFENERDVFQILFATVKESLGKFNFVPSIDFDNQLDIPIEFSHPKADEAIHQPQIKINPTYNPFQKSSEYNRQNGWDKHETKKATNWQEVLSDFENSPESKTETINFNENNETLESRTFIQIKRRFILTTVKSGLMLIDQHRAHFQILFEELQRNAQNSKTASQTMMFPQTIEVDLMQSLIVDEIIEELISIGFDVEKDASNNYQIKAIPVVLPLSAIQEFFDTTIENVKHSGEDISSKLKENVLQNLAKLSAVQSGKELTFEEMCHITDRLFACQSPNYTNDGQAIIQTITMNEIIDRFNS